LSSSAGLALPIVAGSSTLSSTLSPREARHSRRLIKDATVLTLDQTLGNFSRADILIEGEAIIAVGPNLKVSDAEQIDAKGMIAMPGFVDTHRHMWQGCIRALFPDVTLNDYFATVLNSLGPIYRPEDVHIAELVSALSAIDAGVTTILDWSHIQNTPQHTDAAIAALRESGMRVVFGYGEPQLGGKELSQDSHHRYPEDIKRLRKQYFSTDNQLMTLALAADGPSFSPAEAAIKEWEAARAVGARISTHLGVSPDTLEHMRTMNKAGLLRSDTTYIHCTSMDDEVWRMIADTGGTVSIAASVEMQLGIGMPAVQKALDHGIRPSLSVDVETSAPNDLFTQMRTVFALQRALANERMLRGDKSAPKLLGVNDVLEFAISQGARANGLERKAGALTVGKQADIILLRKDRINVVPLHDPVGATVLGMDTGNVDSVFVAGNALKRNGQLLGVDLKHLGASASASQEYLLSRLAKP
jgi:cytosine/adenosine deaminase-related metal-dependent hydrolase